MSVANCKHGCVRLSIFGYDEDIDGRGQWTIFVAAQLGGEKVLGDGKLLR
jgi:hypothetical protein